ncbi:UNKNOWN [Stylonychia lemnae]|uniref:Uncharacterized protein n=1 Tax=Stylonychia lemnae TaxID=5949 RepID=A0A078APL4_STYLE|nr:UNKNOWN [Stylonychia lemnae]|eukprot:CDW84315.1 UNKNOWN [Stylonychia lemnae]
MITLVSSSEISGQQSQGYTGDFLIQEVSRALNTKREQVSNSINPKDEEESPGEKALIFHTVWPCHQLGTKDRNPKCFRQGIQYLSTWVNEVSVG